MMMMMKKREEEKEKKGVKKGDSKDKCVKNELEPQQNVQHESEFKLF